MPRHDSTMRSSGHAGATANSKRRTPDLFRSRSGLALAGGRLDLEDLNIVTVVLVNSFESRVGTIRRKPNKRIEPFEFRAGESWAEIIPRVVAQTQLVAVEKNVL